MNEDVPPIQDLGDFPVSNVSFPRYTQYHHSSKESPFPKLPFLVSTLNLGGGGRVVDHKKQLGECSLKKIQRKNKKT